MLVADTDIGKDLYKQVEDVTGTCMLIVMAISRRRKQRSKNEQDGISKYLNKKNANSMVETG